MRITKSTDSKGNKKRQNAKSDGKERLSVTETNSNINRGEESVRTSQHHTNINRHNDHTDDSIDSSDETDESYYLMLDTELQPEAPDPTSALSEKIFREHKKLAKEYLQVDEQLYYANDEKTKLLANMSPEERFRKEQLIKKMNEKKELLELQQNLIQQLNELKSLERAEGFERNNQLQPYQQQLGSPTESNDESTWVFVPDIGNSGGCGNRNGQS